MAFPSDLASHTMYALCRSMPRVEEAQKSAKQCSGWQMTAAPVRLHWSKWLTVSLQELSAVIRCRLDSQKKHLLCAFRADTKASCAMSLDGAGGCSGTGRAGAKTTR